MPGAFCVGDRVIVLPPFSLGGLDGVYTVAEVTEDGAIFVSEVEGGFDPVYLEKAE